MRPVDPRIVELLNDALTFELSVVNSGPPLAQGTAEQLFKPFWRAAARPYKEGLGLGLFIVAEIARSHGAQLDVASADGTTRFTFRLQRQDPPAPA